MVNREKYEKSVILAEQGRYKEALACVLEYLQTSPEDSEALNDTGALLHCLGRSSQAMDYLLKARQLDCDNPQILMNLIEISIAAGKPGEAEALFDQAQEAGILNPELLNRTAKLFLDQGNKAGAVEVLLRSMKIWPGQEILEHMLTVIKSKRPKIAFFCGADGSTFLEHICDYLKDRFEIRPFIGRTEQELCELMEWSDISWFEWCTELAVVGSNGPKVCKTIVRLHRYEAYTEFPSRVNWRNVDVLITVGNSFVQQALLNGTGPVSPSTSVVTIPNGVDMDALRFVNKPAGKNIAFVGNLRMVKNPSLLLQCMHRLHSTDAEYRLFVAGEFQDGALEQYVRHLVKELGLTGAVVFDGRQSDISRWLADKHYVVSSSIIESQGMGILEAMGCGLKPVIHNFPGASEIYPDEFLFNIVEQFCEQIQSGQYEPARYRKFVEQNYSQKQQLAKINELLIKMEAQIDSQHQVKSATEQDSFAWAH
jgi:tetratricopeptide (TPR) repeat protein